MQIVAQYGTMWARNAENISKIPRSSDDGRGVYVLFDGSMPMYVGKGKIKSRILKASKSERRKELWDHFSWYTIKDPAMTHDIEVLMLRILPPNLRSLTLQGGNFEKAKKVSEDNNTAVSITRKASPQK
jgi:predicted RNA-binding protein YlxR (DUF448 family)